MLETWTLQFTDPTLEKAFCRDYTQHVLSPGDYSRAVIHLSGTLSYHALAYMGPTGLEASGIVYSIILALHILLIACTHEKGLYAPYRTKIVLFLRVVLDGISTIYLGDWVASVMAASKGPSDTIVWLSKYLILATGVSMQAFISWSLPLLFRYNVTLHFFASLLYAAMLNGPACKAACSTAYGSSAVHAAWRAVEAVWVRGANVLWLYHGARPVQRSALAEWPCHAFVTLLQMLLGFALPNLVLYGFEKRARRAFLTSHRRQQAAAAGRAFVASSSIALDELEWPAGSQAASGMEVPFHLAWGLLSTMAICVMWEVSLLVQILLSMTTGVSGSALAADPLSALSAPLVGTSSLSEQL